MSETPQFTNAPKITMRSRAANGVNPKPMAQVITVRVRRTVRIAAYESMEFSEEVQASPDPEFSTRENLRLMRRALMNEVNNACAEFEAQRREES